MVAPDHASHHLRRPHRRRLWRRDRRHRLRHRPPARAARHAQWWHLLGGLGAIPPAAIAGAFAAEHFGTKSLPYLGVGPIFAAVALGVAISGTGFARTAERSIRWPRALLHALWPSGVLALLFGAVASLAPPDVNVELDVMRVYASTLGLGVLGAIGGAFTGAVGGTALATTLVAARRWRRWRRRWSWWKRRWWSWWRRRWTSGASRRWRRRRLRRAGFGRRRRKRSGPS